MFYRLTHAHVIVNQGYPELRLVCENNQTWAVPVDVKYPLVLAGCLPVISQNDPPVKLPPTPVTVYGSPITVDSATDDPAALQVARVFTQAIREKRLLKSVLFSKQPLPIQKILDSPEAKNMVQQPEDNS